MSDPQDDAPLASRAASSNSYGKCTEEVKARIERRLEKDHGEEDFRVLDSKQLAETATDVLAVAQIFLVAITKCE